MVKECGMNVEIALDIGQKALITTLLVAGPMLLVSMVIGVLISLFQAMTQINEITLTFVPKIVAVLVATVICLPWMVRILAQFTEEMLFIIPSTIKL
jgi:flagellar biosynthesis protein FliQ